ncbi:MAG TPA: glycosyltransferase family 4 protein [Anaerolineales bacterium]|nr:glycosyltransferase family 4 protein [Anaerolineales bacterium]
MRLALITNIPAPYRLPVWDSLGQKVDSLRVFLCSETEPNRVWQSEALNGFSFTHTQLSGVHLFIQSLDWAIHFNPALWQELTRYKPTHILLSSYETPSYLLALVYAKFKKIPITLWWESHALSSRFHSGPIKWLKQGVLRQIDSFCSASHPSKEYLIKNLGVPERNVVGAVNTVDVRHWHDLAMQGRENGSHPDRPIHFLYVGQFIKRKGIIELLTAFKSISAETGMLRLVGYGPQESELRTFISEYHMENVEIVGATSTMEQTARQYSWADVLVMPSLSEVWGLVVNEALASGVYVMASKYAGATHDLIKMAPYDVGVSFDPLKNECFVHALLSVIEKQKAIDPRAVSTWGLQHTPEKYAQSLLDAILLADSKAS